MKRSFTPEAPDRLWVADITYVRTWEGWLYLSFVLDTYSRKVVGWSMATHLRAELVLDALNARRSILADHSREDLDAVAAALNDRPRKTHNWHTATEMLNDQLTLQQDPGVASTD